jgi:lipoprotein-anchoring transpeptidase ErfK/SrfK
MKSRYLCAALVLSALAGCGEGDREVVERTPAQPQAEPAPPAAGAASVYGNPRVALTAAELERGRMDPAWRRYVQMDSADAAAAVQTDSATWEDISAATLNRGEVVLPVQGDVAGPSVARVQILLDRALFSPGIIDGRWGKNTEKAVYWLQRREGIPATGRVDRRTYERLVRLAGSPQQMAVQHRLTADDISGPFVEIPEDIYARAEMECMCYETLAEKLAEMFHTSPEMLAQLNPGVDLNSLRAGSTIQAPNVRGSDAARGTQVAKLVISDGGHYVHAMDASGRILFHFPSTLGSDYAPSPTGDFRITTIAEDPTWHYQPDLLTGVPDWKEPAVIPPGPNNAVGVVWMELSKPHYGVHGTSAPETIGYATSHGCVRLTNWDASFLAKRIEAGVPVQFRDVSGGSVTE